MRGLAKRNVVVQNRVGALGNIATEFVAAQSQTAIRSDYPVGARWLLTITS